MSKRPLLMGICLLLLCLTLAAQAQETPPPEQATVNAAVSTLIAQTQGADAQMQMTGTIQAALESALTATAQAQVLALTATPTPEPIDWSNVSVASTTEIDLRAGPGGTAAILAPGGQRFAYLERETFCLYQGETEAKCIELGEEIRPIDTEAARWSPDSHYLAFHEDFFRLFNDPDIWVWDTVTNEVRNLTDDGNTSNLLRGEMGAIDITPTWLPDGRLLFLRYRRTEGQFFPPDIYTVNPDGSGLTQLGTIQLSDPFNDPLPIYAMDASATHLVYAHASQRGMPDDGIWISNWDGSDARLVSRARRRDQLALSVDVSPDERYALIGTVAGRLGGTPFPSLVQAVSIETGEMFEIDPGRTTRAAGWTPEGSGLIYTTFAPEDDADEGLYFSETPGTPGHRLLDGGYSAPTSRQEQSLVWGTNDMVLLSRSPEQGIVLAQLAR
jgi:hypothetical protein